MRAATGASEPADHSAESDAMNTERPIGHSGLTTPALVLGGNVFGWTADRDTSFAVLDTFFAGGGRMIDTAEVYSNWVPGHVGGESETVIGEWMKARGNRDQVLIATKVGYTGAPGALTRDGIAAAIDGSLQRLQTDRVDVYYAHIDDSQTPLEETMAAFGALITAGKVRAFGASNYSAERLAALDAARRSVGAPQIAVFQPHYNLMHRAEFEGPVQQYCQTHGIGVMPYFALASGFLTGKYRTPADLTGARGGWVGAYLDAFGLGVLAALDRVAAETGATPGQVALAWLAAQPGITAPIASATSVAQAEELVGAMRLTLDAEQIALLDRVSTQGV